MDTGRSGCAFMMAVTSAINMQCTSWVRQVFRCRNIELLNIDSSGKANHALRRASHMRHMWRVKFPAASLLTEVPVHRFVHPKLLAHSYKVGAAIGSELFRRASECEEASQGIYADYLNVYSPRTSTAEHGGPPLALHLSSSGVSGCDRPGPIYIKTHICKRRAGSESFGWQVRHALFFQLPT